MSNADPTRAPLLTLEEYLRLPDDGSRTELVRGRVVREPPPATLHGRLQSRIAYLIETYEQARGGRGAVAVGSGFLLAVDPPTVRGPDVSYVAAERIPEAGSEEPYWQMGPDLAVEIVSPSNLWTEMQRKVGDYLAAGTRLVWVVDPPTRTVTVYRPGAQASRLEAGAELDGGEVLPGFRVALGELFTL